MKTILQLATYDVSDPRSGGAIRAYHVAQSLRSQFSVQALVFGLKDIHGRVKWEDDQGFDKSFGSRINIDAESCLSKIHSDGEKGVLLDWGICEYVLNEQALTKALCRMVKNLAPSAILLEQPYLWPIVDMLFRQGAVSGECRLIYSSHNCEAPMKREIYSTAFSTETCDRHTATVSELERQAIGRSDLIIAASAPESHYIKSFAEGKKILVLPNGHTHDPTIDDDWWKNRMNSQLNIRNWVFTSSGHPPNVRSLKKFLDAVPLDQTQPKIWILGSIGKEIDVSRYPFVEIFPEITNRDINAAICQSSGIMLPVWEGGGTNLKTAQALLTGKPIVSTSYAFRGFEEYQNGPGIYISDSAAEMLDLMMHIPLTSYRRENTDRLDFSKIMISLPTHVQELF